MDKVRNGGGTRFDPMLEERGGWITGEAQQNDSDMTEAVIGIMAEASDQIGSEGFNPFKGKIGEVLPSNLERNSNENLVRKDAISFRVNSEKLLARIVVLQDQLLITKFVGPKPPIQAMKLWLRSLDQELRGNTLTLNRSLGK